ncbi:MAG: glycosyltransferase family 2 protein [Parcubacteria group bacterium]|jgi:GT2 family glycosyltransferase
MKTSIIIVAYNSEKDIVRALDSVFETTPGDNWEIILVENKSTDKTLEVIEKYLQSPDDNLRLKIKLIKSNKNLGFGGGCNLGTAQAEGELLIFLNPDTLTRPGWLAPIVSKFEKDDKTGVLGPKILYEDEKTIQAAGGWVEGAGFAHHFGYGEEDNGQWDEEKEVDYVTGACLAIRKKIYEKCLGFDENYFPGYYEETELCLKTKNLGYRVIYFPESSIIHLESRVIGLFSYNYYHWFHKHRWRYVLKNFPAGRIFFSAIPFEIKWLLNNFVKKVNLLPRQKETAAGKNILESKKKDNRELKALLKAYFLTLFKLPNILYYRYFKYYA